MKWNAISTTIPSSGLRKLSCNVPFLSQNFISLPQCHAHNVFRVCFLNRLVIQYDDYNYATRRTLYRQLLVYWQTVIQDDVNVIVMWWTRQTSELESSEREAVRKAIDTPQAVLLVCLRTTKNNVINSEGDGAELAVANVHVTWSQLKYPALQALQVGVVMSRIIVILEFLQIILGNIAVPWSVCLSVCHVLALCSNGRRYRHNFFCIRQPHVHYSDRFRIWLTSVNPFLPKFCPKVTHSCWFERRTHSMANCSRMVRDIAQ